MGTVTHTIQAVPINHYILLASLLFTIGVMGVLVRRNAIVIFMSIELMLNAVNILLAAFSLWVVNLVLPAALGALFLLGVEKYWRNE